MSTVVGSGQSNRERGEDAASAAVSEARSALAGGDPDFCVVFSSSAYDYRAVVDTVRAETGGATLIGSSSAGEFTESGPSFQSVAVSLVESDDLRLSVGVGTGLREDLEGTVREAAEGLPELDGEYPYRRGINLHDGLVGRGEEIALLGYQEYPIGWVGGSAADDLELEETVVFADDTVATDAVALGLLESKKPFAQAVGHGHDVLAGSFEVSAAEGSVVETLDGRPAYEAWKDAVRDAARSVYDVDVDEVDPEDDRFGELLTRFEFGIRTTEGAFKIRWPGLTPDTDGPMHFATKIPEGTELYVMDSAKADQIAAAETVSRDALAGGDDEFTPAGALAFDCVCQAAILGEEFDEAVGRMARELDVPLAGMQTYGEVGMQEGDMRAYHNTTSSLVLLPE